MKICAFSDMHGQIGFDVEPCDLVLIAGDVVPLRLQVYYTLSEIWLKEKFIPWCEKMPCDKVVFVGGNHDWYLDSTENTMKEYLKDHDKVVYLDCESYEYGGKVIYGTPLCHKFKNWAFMPPLDEQREKYKDVENVDIILSHDAPYGTSDVLLQEDCPWANGNHIGNEALTELTKRVKPSLLLHGHLHSTNHDKEMLDDTEVYNVSLLNENYDMVYRPLYLEI